MRVNLNAYLERDEDGYTGNVSVDREDVDDLTTMAQVVKDFLLGLGFSYVDDVGFSKSDGTMVWGENF